MGFLDEHRLYLSDAFRVRAYRRALARAVRPGDVVLDLGAGTGILGLLALRAGAARVYAVEEGPVLEIAREAVRDAGFGDRWVGIRGRSTAIDLPERADLLVCDHLGSLALDYGILEACADARRRLLRRGARLVPEAVEVRVALLSSPRLHAPVAFWTGAARRSAAHEVRSAELRRGERASAPGRVLSVDLRTAPDGDFAGRTVLRADRAARIHGLVASFRARLAPGVTVSNEPFARDALRRAPAILPLEAPIPVRRGERVPVALRIRPSGGLVTWTVRGEVHSTFLGAPLSAGELRRRSAGHRPALSPRGEALARVLDLCRRGRSVGAIRADLCRRFPRLFPDGDRAAAFVAAALEQAAC